MTAPTGGGQDAPEGSPGGDEILETPSAEDDIARFWHIPAVDLEGRRRLLRARALAAGRPAGMRSWADDNAHDTGRSDRDGPN
jgi:hypothetical protein